MRASDIVKKKDRFFRGEASPTHPLQREGDAPRETEDHPEPDRQKQELDGPEVPISADDAAESHAKTLSSGQTAEAGSQGGGLVRPLTFSGIEGQAFDPRPAKREGGFRLSDSGALDAFFSGKQMAGASGATLPEDEGLPDAISEAADEAAAAKPDVTEALEPFAGLAEREIVSVAAQTMVSLPEGLSARPEDAVAPDAPMPSSFQERVAPAEPEISVTVPGVVGMEEHEEGTVKGLYRKAQRYLHEAKRRVSAGERIDIEPAVEIIQDIIGMPRERDPEIYQLTVDFGQGDDYFLSHAVNTSIYAVRIGQRLEYPKAALLELGLSALLCDVGMFRISDAILNKEEKLSLAEIDLIKSHTEMGREIMAPFRDRFPAVLDAIWEHQERENGNGYPRGLKGDEISEFAKIIGICDSFEAMTHNRPHKRALVQTESIRELIGAKNQLFSPRIIKAFLDEVSIFPIGSYVRLNNRNIGRVIETNRSNPLKPTIKLLYDEAGRRIIEQRVIELSKNPVLNIEESVSRDELPM